MVCSDPWVSNPGGILDHLCTPTRILWIVDSERPLWPHWLLERSWCAEISIGPGFGGHVLHRALIFKRILCASNHNELDDIKLALRSLGFYQSLVLGTRCGIL